MEKETNSLGDYIREARVRKERSLRQEAKNLDVTPSYLSDIENNRRVPAEPILRKISHELDLDFDKLMSLAGRFGKEAELYLRSQPKAIQLFRRIAEDNMNDIGLQRLIDQIGKDEKGKGKRK